MNVEYINPGDLDRRVKIMRPRIAIGTKGQEIIERRPLAERYASVSVDATDEDVEDGNIHSVRWLDIVMYKTPMMMLTDELIYDGKIYNIISINDVRLTPFVKVRAREITTR